jgi:two-component system phosphate regulon response regulator PhoB
VIIRGYSSQIAQTVQPLVVVADDDPAFRMLLRVNLELESYRVREAANAAEVRAALAEEGVDLVLLDVRLGEDDGIELARELRGTRPKLAIAFLTGSTLGPSEEAHLVGDAVVQKPFELDELSETVARLTRR